MLVRQTANTQSTITVKTDSGEELVLMIVAEDCGSYAVNYTEDGNEKAGIFADGEDEQELYTSQEGATFDGPDTRYEVQEMDNAGNLQWVEISLDALDGATEMDLLADEE